MIYNLINDVLNDMYYSNSTGDAMDDYLLFDWTFNSETNQYISHLRLAGFDKSNINIVQENDNIIITATRKNDNVLPDSSITKRLLLPTTSNSSTVTSKFLNGILYIYVDKDTSSQKFITIE